jgi:hypothetical protein
MLGVPPQCAKVMTFIPVMCTLSIYPTLKKKLTQTYISSFSYHPRNGTLLHFVSPYFLRVCLCPSESLTRYLPKSVNMISLGNFLGSRFSISYYQ